MKTRKHQYSFAAGEVSPEFYGRGDSAQYQTGVATARNFVIKPQGSARTRPGFEFVGRTATQDKPTHLIPFNFSTDEAYIVALGDQNLRLYRNGSPISYGVPIDVGEGSSPDAVKVGTLNPLDSDWERYGGLQTQRNHGLLTGDYIVLAVEPGGVLPTVASYRWFRVVVEDPRRLILERDSNPDTPAQSTWVKAPILQSQATNASGFVRAWKLEPLEGSIDSTPTQSSGRIGVARTYNTEFTMVTSNASGLNTKLWYSSADCFEIGDPVRFTAGASTAVAGGGYTGDVYVIGKGRETIPNNGAYGPFADKTLAYIEVGLTPTSTTKLAATTISYDNKMQRRIQAGELVFWNNGGVEAGFFSVNTGHLGLEVNEFTGGVNGPDGSASYFQRLSESGELEVTTPYAAEDVADVAYDQSGDVLTLVHPKYPEQELRRYGDTYWELNPVSFSPPLAAPTNVDAIPTYAQQIEFRDTQITAAGGTNNNTDYATFKTWSTDLAAGDIVIKLSGTVTYGSSGTGVANGERLVIARVYNDASTFTAFDISFRRLVGDEITDGSGNPTFALSDLIRDRNDYKISAVDKDGNETLSVATGVVINALDFPGAKNTVSWDVVTGADKYIVYRQEGGSGLFEKISEVLAPTLGDTVVTFVDDGVPGDGSITAPRYDDDIAQSTNYSRATARFEQRRCFAGSDLFPRRLFMSKTGTESDFSFRIPVLDSDRISVEASAREAHVIQHLVPLGDLLLLTQLGEWRLFAVNSDAITPNSVSIRPQSYVGSSTVRPLVSNSSVLFCAARGGHVRQMGYEASRSGFTTGDLSLRAAHLFDDFEIVRSGQQKAPVPVAWFVSSTGKLLGLTYVPEEQISAWHQHDTDGAFESVACVPEGREDSVYVVVKRTVNGQTVRNIERMSTLSTEEAFTSSVLDDSLRYDGLQPGTLTVTSGSYLAGGQVVLESTAEVFSYLDVGRRVYFGDARYRADITAVTDTQTVEATLVADIPSTAIGVAMSWQKAATEISGLQHLEGEAVQVLQTDDRTKLGTVQTLTVSDGRIDLNGYATVVEVGRGFTCDLKLLPTTLQMPALGYGRDKAINRAWVRVFDAAGLSVGPDENSLAPVAALQNLDVLATKQTRNIVPSDWSDDAQLLIRQTQPYPATVAAVTIEVSVAE